MRRRLLMNKIGGETPDPNTFIGGVGATSVTSAADLASLTSLSVGDIENFVVDAYNNVSCYIGVDWTFNTNAFNPDSDITYFYSSQLSVSLFGTNSGVFKNSTIRTISSNSYDCYGYYLFNTSNLEYGYFAEATYLGGYRQFANIDNLKRLYLASITSTNSITTGSNSSFVNSTFNGTLYLPNGYSSIGSLSTFASYATTAGATIKEITDFTLPTAASSLSIDTTGASYLELSFTAGTSVNTIDFYEVWVNDGGGWQLWTDFDSTSGFIVGLNVNTSYDIKVATCDEFWNGSGLNPDITKRVFSSEVSVTTNTSDIPTTNLFAYYNLEQTSDDVIDIFGGYNATNYGATRGVTGKVNDCFSFDGTNDYIDIGDVDLDTDDAYSLGIWFKTSATNIGVLIARDDVNERFWQFRVDANGKVRFIRFDSSDSVVANFASTSTFNDGNWHLAIVTFDSSVGSKIYVDNSLEASDTDLTANKTGTGCSVHIGRLGAPAYSYINGDLDEAFIYENHALTTSEMSDIWNGGSGETL